MLEKLTLEDFESIRGRPLTLRFGDQTQTGVVIQAHTVAGGRPDSREPFSVILRSGSSDSYWPQGAYILEHPDHGELELFMVPVGPDDEGMCYELSFS